ncbi:MAG: metallophosphoesterase family protein [Bacillota bacterium]
MNSGSIKSFLISGRTGTIALYLTAIITAFFFMGIFGNHVFQVEALRIRLGVQPSLTGQTVVEIPPLASIAAQTHSTPVKISLRLEYIDLSSIQEMVNGQNHADMMEKFAGRLRTEILIFAAKIILLAAAGGFFGVFLWRRKPGMAHLRGALTAALTAGLLLAATYSTFDINRFRNPQFNGVLKMAPWLIGLNGQSMDNLDSLNAQVSIVAENINQLFNQLYQAQDNRKTPEGLVKVLHLSDIHNNPAGMLFARRIAALFNVDMIIDTGDITDFGTPLEGQIMKKIPEFKKPYLFLPGNHDSPETIKMMGAVPGVRVLDGSALTVKGLRILGVPDPQSATSGVKPPSKEMITRYSSQIEEQLSHKSEKPDILALHNNHIARELAGVAPVILYGHDHRLFVGEKKGSVLIDAGSSGASGVRGLLDGKSPYSMVIQYYSPQKGKMALLAADAISIDSFDGSFHVEHHVFRSKE